jgi:putative mRNA 3-end processing factor
LEIHFLGGAGEVGRSGILLKGKKNVLLDYGVKLDVKIEYPMNAGRVDAFVLSHAHLDHSGNAPALYNAGSPVSFGTPPTLKLSELLLEDSMKISRKNRVAHKFSKKDYHNFQRKFMSYDYNSPIDFADYQITLHDAGHISGSSMPLIEDTRNGKRLLYTGDFKLSPQLLRHGADVVKADVLITESTYATSEHPERSALERSFIDDVKQVTDNKGTALVAVFAVGRAQELLALLYNNRLIDIT